MRIQRMQEPNQEAKEESQLKLAWSIRAAGVEVFASATKYKRQIEYPVAILIEQK